MPVPEDKVVDHQVELGNPPVEKHDIIIAENAFLATEEEHNLTFAQAVKKYRKACLWSMLFSLCIIMDGYDTAILGALPAFPAFCHRFGSTVGNTAQYQLEPS